MRYKGKSIADVLEMTVEEALALLRERAVRCGARSRRSHDVGLGYLQLGQPATTLSGGEAQRIKLARELARRATGRTLYLLDEPTTGLHFADVERTCSACSSGWSSSATRVVVIEHHLDVIAERRLGDRPRARGRRRGRRASSPTGTPEEVARVRREPHRPRARARRCA